MDSAELHLTRVSQQLALVAMQAAAAYNQTQSKLDLADVLSGDRLMAEASQ